MSWRLALRRALYHLRMLRKAPPVFALLLIPLAARMLSALDGRLGLLPWRMRERLLVPYMPHLWLLTMGVIAVALIKPRFSLRTLVLAQAMLFSLIAVAATFGPFTRAFSLSGGVGIGFTADGRYALTAPMTELDPADGLYFDVETGEVTAAPDAPELSGGEGLPAANGMVLREGRVHSPVTGGEYGPELSTGYVTAISPCGTMILVQRFGGGADGGPGPPAELWRLTRRPEWWGFLTLPAFWMLVVSVCAFSWSLERDMGALRRRLRPGGWYGYTPPVG